MSLVNEYRNSLRERLGIKEEDPTAAPTAAPTGVGDAGMGGLGAMDEESLKAMLELLNNEIAKREAVGETAPEGMEDPDAKAVIPQEAPAGGGPAAGAAGAVKPQTMDEAATCADDVYFEMLNTFKTNIANCQDSMRKKMYTKCYEMCYKMRDKFIKEMTAPEEQAAAAPATAPIK